MATSLQKAQVQSFCKLCKNDSVVNWKCLQCTDLLCNDCKGVHQKLSTTKNHQVVSIKEINRQLLQENKTSYVDYVTCQQHSKACKHFCEECNAVICKKCSSKEHRDHKFKKISNVRKATEEKIKALQTIIMSRQNTYEEIQTNKSEAKLKIESEMRMRQETMTKSINNRYISLQKDLEEHFDKLNSDLKTWHDNKGFAALKAKQRELEKLLEVSDIRKLVTRFKKMQDDVNDRLLEIPILNHVVFQPGQMSHDDLSLEFGSLHFPVTMTAVANIESLEIVTQVETDFKRINLVCPLQGGLIWISDNEKAVLQIVKSRNLTAPIIQISIDIEDGCVFGDQLFVSDCKNKAIKRIAIDGNINVVKKMNPLTPLCLYVASSGDIIVGVRDSSDDDTDSIRCWIMRMTMSGETKQEFEYDKRGIRLFTDPIRCTMNEKNEDILTIDGTGDMEGRLICITCTGSVKFKYFGNLSLDLPDAFSPSSISCLDDVIIINDYANNGMHLLSSDGDFIKYISYTEFGIEHPLTSNFDENGQLWLGSVKFSGKKAKLYQIMPK